MPAFLAREPRCDSAMLASAMVKLAKEESGGFSGAGMYVFGDERLFVVWQWDETHEINTIALLANNRLGLPQGLYHEGPEGFA